MHNYSEHYWGMHVVWWIIWGIFLFWIFFTPYNIPYQKSKKESYLDILNKRYAQGEITKEEYEEIKRDIDSKNE